MLSSSKLHKKKTYKNYIFSLYVQLRFYLNLLTINNRKCLSGITEETKEPYICSFDMIGCSTHPPDFTVSGSCEENLFGE